MNSVIHIQLHDASAEMYEGLHSTAATELLNRIRITGSDTGARHMYGTYTTDGYGTKEAVMAAAKRAVLAIGASASIVVSGNGDEPLYSNCVPEVNFWTLLGTAAAQPNTAPVSPWWKSILEARPPEPIPASLQEGFITAILGK